ncbi:MAG: hypothetical protein MI724_05310 [Spirochaetales bacterium]|nr:hypothetical protein [Spirochaetales bacterium]
MSRFHDVKDYATTDVRVAVRRGYRVGYAASVLLLLVGALTVLGNSGFLFSARIWNGILGSNVPLLILTPGVILVLKQGEIDLSVGSLTSLSAAIFGAVVAGGYGGPVVAAVAACGAAIACGALQGALVGYTKVPSFAVSFVGANLFQLLAVGLVRPTQLLGLQATFTTLLVPMGLLAAGCVIGTTALLAPRVTGRLFPAAVDAEALSLSRVVSFSIVGLLAGLAGIFATTRIGSTNAFLGNGLEVQLLIVALASGFFFRRTRHAILWSVVAWLMYSVATYVMFFTETAPYLQFTVTNGLLVVYSAAFLTPSLMRKPPRHVRRQQWIVLGVASGLAISTVLLWLDVAIDGARLNVAQFVYPAALLGFGTLGYLRNRDGRVTATVDT